MGNNVPQSYCKPYVNMYMSHCLFGDLSFESEKMHVHVKRIGHLGFEPIQAQGHASFLGANIWNVSVNEKASSTAQGGGGSFNNWKTIGEIGCCESWMPEQKHWPTD